LRLRDAFIETYNEMQKKKIFPVFLSGTDIRTGIFMMLERELSSRSFAVLAMRNCRPIFIRKSPGRCY